MADLLVLLVLLTPAFLKRGRFADDPGVGWHLQTGRWIMENGAIPTIDPFLAASVERPWVSDQWLSDVLFFGLFDQFSWLGLYATLTGVFLLLFFGIAHRAAGVVSGTWLGAAFATLCALKLATIHFILRPVMFGFVFFAIVFGVCARLSSSLHRDVESAEPSLLKRLMVLPPVFLLWANLHPSFVLGLVVVGILAAACFLEPFFFRASHALKERWYGAGIKVAGALLLCVGATLLNPYGFALHESIFELAGSEFFARFNSEWHSPDFLEGSGQLTLVVFMMIFSSRVLAGDKGQKLSLFEFGALAALTIGYLRSVRLLPFLAIVLVVPLAIAVKNFAHAYVFEWMEALRPITQVAARLERWEAKSSRGIVGLVVAALVLVGSVATGALPRADHELGPTAAKYPYGAVNYLLERPEPAVIFATPNWGGFITWTGEGRIRAHIDDRNTLLGEAVYRNYAQIAGVRSADWLDKLRKTGATHLLVEIDSPLRRAADNAQLHRAFADANTVLFDVQ